MKSFIFSFLILGTSAASKEPFEASFLRELYKADPTANHLVFSPVSLRLAFDIVRLGASADSKNQIDEVLSINERWSNRTQKLFSSKDTSDFRLSSSNGLWIHKKYSFNQGFLKSVQRSFQPRLGSFDPLKANEAAREVNSWVASKTNNLIKELVSPQVFRPDSRSVIVNAIYFLGEWVHRFDSNDTRKLPFRGKKTEQVDTMIMLETFRYWELDQLDVLELPYLGDAVRMLILLPKDVLELGKHAPELLGKGLAEVGTEAKEGEVALRLPKLSLRSRPKGIKKALKKVGLDLPFTSGNAFPLILSNNESLVIGDVIHEAVVKVDEKGTEAAAATALMMLLGGMPQEKAPPKEFHVDRPFLFVIDEKHSGEVLFVGAVSQVK